MPGVTIIDPPDLAVSMSGLDATLTWSASQSDSIAGYDVYRRSPATGMPFVPGVDTPIATGVTSPYSDAGLAAGDYEWQVFGTAGVFSPTDFSGLVGWWDASAAGSITSTGSNLTTWADLSSSGADLSPVGTVTTGLRTENGLNVIGYAGSAALTGSLTLSQPFSIFLVCVVDDSLAGAYHFVWGDPALGLRIDTAYASAGTELYGAGFATQSVFCQLTGIYNGSSSEVYGDGANSAAGNAGTSGITSIRINGRPGDGSFANNGAIGEIVVYDSALGTTDRQAVESYLKAKWGTP